LFGALYVAATVVLAPRLGPGFFFALLIAGQLLIALAIEHYGWLGFAPQPVTAERLLGAVLLIAGVLLVRRP
jgi:transporter family-2 protein